MDELSDIKLQHDASELSLSTDERYVCETYIFDPAPGEEKMGRLFAVGETEDRGGVGRELLDLTVQALQREYYRDPTRAILVSFESALHQANLVLHDASERGVRDWMGYFHVAVGVLAGNLLHISCAGNASVQLARRTQVTAISEDLAYSPITNPLRTFAQVASGDVQVRDVLFLGTSHFAGLFPPADLSRFAIDHSAATITTRLQQLYSDKGSLAPLAVVAVSLLPQHIAPTVADTSWLPLRRQPREVHSNLVPRKPLIINRSWLKTMLLFVVKVIATLGSKVKTIAWPLILKGSQQGGRAVVHVSKTSGRKVQSLTRGSLTKWRSPSAPTSEELPATVTTPPPLRSFTKPLSAFSMINRRTLGNLPTAILRFGKSTLHTLPKSSKVFALLTVILLIALVVSLLLLQRKRTGDAAIQHASELLHDTRNHVQAAEAALIYDNRDQARTLIEQARAKNQELAATNLYQEDAVSLATKLTTLSDRMQKIVRAGSDVTTVIGDFKDHIAKSPTALSFVNDALYVFNPETNVAVRMDLKGETAPVNDTTQGIGFFTTAATHPADKVIVLATNTPGLALFDAKENTLQSVDAEFPSKETTVISLATYGTRLYAYDTTSHNILSFSKTLRGYSGGQPWITNGAFPKDTIRSIGVDGSIYTLHTDGAIRKLLKGEPEEFKTEVVQPPLAGATKLIKSEDTKNIYVLDPANKRVIIFTTTGQLIRQVYLEATEQLVDIAISADEKTVYALDGTRIVAVALAD